MFLRYYKLQNLASESTIYLVQDVIKESVLRWSGLQVEKSPSLHKVFTKADMARQNWHTVCQMSENGVIL